MKKKEKSFEGKKQTCRPIAHRGSVRLNDKVEPREKSSGKDKEGGFIRTKKRNEGERKERKTKDLRPQIHLF